MDSARKLPKILDDPTDNFILDNIVDPINPLFFKMNMTPNKLTAISGIFGLLSAYYAYKSKYALASLLFLISYIFDCFDGNFARRYNMVTEFGDWFDHIKDSFIIILLFIIIIYKKDITFNIKIISLILFLVFLLLSFCYLKEQELIYHKNNDNIKKSNSLNILNNINLFKNYTSEEKLKYLKYFGCGGFNLIIVIILILFEITKFKNP